MLTKRIIPCLDVNAGRVVKGVKFLDLRDAGDPVEIARAYDREGADELCFLDITASHENRSIILDVVARTAEQVFMPLTVGGGINKTEDIRALLKAGDDIALTRMISERVSIPVIASGGVGDLEHIYEGLTQGKASAALAASIFHFREYSIADCKRYLESRGVAIRPVS